MADPGKLAQPQELSSRLPFLDLADFADGLPKSLVMKFLDDCASITRVAPCLSMAVAEYYQKLNMHDKAAEVLSRAISQDPPVDELARIHRGLFDSFIALERFYDAFTTINSF